MFELCVIGLGGALGAVIRFVLGNILTKVLGGNWPYGTFVINLAGCFLMGVLMTIIVERGLLPPIWRMFLCVGLLGGFTTFSSFGFEGFTLMAEGRLIESLAYIAGSLGCGLLAVTMGVFMARI